MFPKLLIFKSVVEQTRMVMRTTVFFAVLTAMEKPNFCSISLSQPLHKSLEFPNVYGPICRQMLIVIGKRDEAVIVVQRCFVVASNGPLSGPFEATTYALTATKGERSVDPGIIPDEGYFACGRPIRLLRRIADHFSATAVCLPA